MGKYWPDIDQSLKLELMKQFDNPSNLEVQSVLEKAGFQREGTMRDESFDRGELRDYYLYSIIRREWEEPRILTKAT